MQATARRIFAGLIAGVAALATAPAAWASISPTLTLDQSGGTNAGGTVPLGMDLHFSPSGGDSPKDMTLTLPPGLASDASIDGGACLQSTAPIAPCQVGTGTVTVVPAGSLAITFYLVAPPQPGDLAGLAVVVNLGGSQLGSPGEIMLRPSDSPAGVGVSIVFHNIPNTLPEGVGSVSVQELQSSLSGVRMPTSCAAANFGVTADSYNDSTERTTSAPLSVTNCSSLPYTPAFHITAVKDPGDAGVRVTTDVTQPATPAQATSRTVKLTLPSAVLLPNAAAAISGRLLCSDPTLATCAPIGSATSSSPLYPVPLTGKAYLTGQFLAPVIKIVFPPPFALTINGAVDLANNSTTFMNVPDVPVTDLKVTLNGGQRSAFITLCDPASGIATAGLTSQNGDQTRTVSAPFTVSGCGNSAGRARLSSASLRGLAHGLPSLRFKLVSAANGPKLKSFGVRLPHGLSFVRRRVHHRLVITGVSLTGARIKSLALVHGRLIVTLRHPASSVTVKIGPTALKESRALESKAKRHRLPRLNLSVAITDTAGGRTTASVRLAGR